MDQTFAWETRIKEAKPDAQGTLLVSLEQNMFYPGGGGQPPDYGTIENSSFSGKVVDAYKRAGETILVVKLPKGELHVGDTVRCAIDAQRRLQLTKSHTGQHALFRCLELVKEAKGQTISVEKVALDTDECGLFVVCESLTLEECFVAEDMLQQLIKDGKRISVREIAKADVHAYPKLRAKLDRIASDTVRIVEIEGHDQSACAGTHCDSLAEVGSVLVTKVRSSPSGFEIRFRVDDLAYASRISKEARRIGQLLNNDADRISQPVDALMHERDKWKSMAQEELKRASSSFAEERLERCTLLMRHFEDADNKSIVTAAGSAVRQGSVVLVTNKETGDDLKYALFVADDLPFDAGQLIRGLNIALKGKGGGKKEFAMGSVPCSAAELVASVKRLL